MKLKMLVQKPAIDAGARNQTVKGWIQLSRLPFHLVGIFPFVLGSMLAWRIYGMFSWPVFGWSTFALILIMLSTYYSGEYHDIKEDKLSARMDRNTFSGGSQAIIKGLMPHTPVKIAAYISLILAGIIGLMLQFHYKTGPWTVPLGIIGIISGFFYSTPPLRWVKRGIGEIMIGFCYGWLPVATAFYLQTGTMDNILHWISIPIACTIFNVILINEFPDYPADMMVEKRNLVVRLGKNSAAFLYITMTVAAWITFIWAVSKGLPAVSILFYLPIFLIAFRLVIKMFKKDYLHRKQLETICGQTIVVNLGSTMALILAFWFGR
jgi:1,4-dihydroxy-2-naphthoate polyprenyltransferase